MLNLILLDFNEVLVLTSLLVDLDGVLFEDTGLSCSELACLLCLLVYKLLVSRLVLDHLIGVLVSSSFKFFVVLVLQCTDLSFKVFFDLSFSRLELLNSIPCLQLVA